MTCRLSANRSVRISKLINPKLSSRDQPKIGKQFDNFMLRRQAVSFCYGAWQKGQEIPDFAVK
jgi:hypothetical protein